MRIRRRDREGLPTSQQPQPPPAPYDQGVVEETAGPLPSSTDPVKSLVVGEPPPTGPDPAPSETAVTPPVTEAEPTRVTEVAEATEVVEVPDGDVAPSAPPERPDPPEGKEPAAGTASSALRRSARTPSKCSTGRSPPFGIRPG